MKKTSLWQLSLLLLAGILFPGFADYQVTRTISWTESRLFIDLDHTIQPGTIHSPTLRFDAEQELENNFISLLTRALLDLQVDSLSTLGDYLAGDGTLSRRLNTVITSSKKEYSYLSRAKDRITLRFSSPLFGEGGLAGCFINHQEANPIPPHLGFIPTRPYTGIVIFARGTYPLYGKKETASLVPLLFPEFYDEELRLFFDKQMCDPAYLLRWGMAAYTAEFDESAFRSRIGEAPLRISLRGLFGRVPSDLILPTEAVNRVLALEENRRLLKEGRIVIICDLAGG